MLKDLSVKDTPLQTERPVLPVIVLLALAYFATGWVGLTLTIETGFATPVWPPSGIALAGVLLFGRRVWPGIFLGSFCANIFSPGSFRLQEGLSIAPLLMGLGIAGGASLQAVGGAVLTRRYANFPNLLLTPHEVVSFFIVAGPIVPPCSYGFDRCIQTRT